MATVPGSVVAVQPFADAVSSEHGSSCLVGRGVRKAACPEPAAAGASVRVRAARKSEPAGVAAAAARPSQQLSIRSSLGQRGGVVKKSDGFDVFYGLVGDQPGSNTGTATPVPPATAQPTAVDSGAAQKPSMRPVLGKRGGVVRKSDAFEVFYGLVGDQPSGAVPGNQAKDGLRSVPEVSKQDAPANLQENGDVLETAKTEAKEKEGEQEGTTCISPTKQAPNIAEFSLATPAASFSPGPGGPHVLDAQFAERKLAGELSKRLSAGSPKSPILEFSLATPAASFSPTKRPVPQKDYYEDPETDYYCEDLGDLPDHLNVLGDKPVEQHLSSLQARLNAVANAPAEFSLATPAASLAPCQAIPELDISNVAARVPAPSGRSGHTGGGHGAGLWSISTAGFPDFFSAGSLQSRLEGLDGAIAKLRALNSN